MNWRQHLIFGSIITAVPLIVMSIIGMISYNDILPIIVAVAAGTLMPDIDHQMGKMRAIVMGIGLVVALYGLTNRTYLIIGLATTTIGFVAPFITKHRGITHTLQAACCYGITIGIVATWPAGIAGAIAYWTHLLLDEIPLKTKQ